MFVSETYVITDYWYNGTASYNSDSSLSVTLPSEWKITFKLHPTSRQSGSGGQSHYVKTKNTSTSAEYWFGQGTSGGSHGIMVRPSTNLWCSSYTTLNEDNDVTVTFQSGTITYTCNGESKTTSASGINSLFGVSATSGATLKAIKVIKL